ncbi:MAG: HAD family acid phosphatase [Vicinamibacteria bacterium]
MPDKTGTLRRMGHRVVVAVAALGSACATAPTKSSVPNLFDVQKQIEVYLDSGRYEADVAAVTTRAQAYMEKRARQVARPAAVFDVDETSLSNWPAYRANGWGRITSGGCDVEAGPCGLRAWQALGQSKAIRPTLALARRARELGVAVFFITGRPQDLREATERNLREQGYEPDGLVLFPDGPRPPSAADFKVPERRKLTEEGYTILFTIGDQESDLKGGYAEQTFKLPNPVYNLP